MQRKFERKQGPYPIERKDNVNVDKEMSFIHRKNCVCSGKIPEIENKVSSKTLHKIIKLLMWKDPRTGSRLPHQQLNDPNHWFPNQDVFHMNTCSSKNLWTPELAPWEILIQQVWRSTSRNGQCLWSSAKGKVTVTGVDLDSFTKGCQIGLEENGNTSTKSYWLLII